MEKQGLQLKMVQTLNLSTPIFSSWEGKQVVPTRSAKHQVQPSLSESPAQMNQGTRKGLSWDSPWSPQWVQWQWKACVSSLRRGPSTKSHASLVSWGCEGHGWSPPGIFQQEILSAEMEEKREKRYGAQTWHYDYTGSPQFTTSCLRTVQSYNGKLWPGSGIQPPLPTPILMWLHDQCSSTGLHFQPFAVSCGHVTAFYNVFDKNQHLLLVWAKTAQGGQWGIHFMMTAFI